MYYTTSLTLFVKLFIINHPDFVALYLTALTRVTYGETLGQALLKRECTAVSEI